MIDKACSYGFKVLSNYLIEYMASNTESITPAEPQNFNDHLKKIELYVDELKTATSVEGISDRDYRTEGEKLLLAARSSLSAEIRSGLLSTENIVEMLDKLSRLQDEITTVLLDVAQIDDITGLPNSNLFNKRLKEIQIKQHDILDSAENRVEFLTIAIYIDLDNLKPVNMVLGHQGGDALIKAAAQKIRNELRSGDLITAVGEGDINVESGRVGGDEFIIVIDKVVNPNLPADQVAKDLFSHITNKLIHSMSKFEFEFEGAPYTAEATIGYAYTMDFDKTDPKQFIADADYDMQSIKARKKEQDGWKRQ
jgi:diguanylate cyclase (GGDEF)-like protein